MSRDPILDNSDFAFGGFAQQMKTGIAGTILRRGIKD